MKTLRTTLAAALSALAIAALTASAALAYPGGHGPGKRHRGPHPEMMIEHMAEVLDLDEATVAEMQAVVQGTHEQGEALHTEIREARETMHDMMKAEELDREAIMAQVDRLAALEGDALRLRIGTLLDVRALLTPEQRAALTAMREDRRNAIDEACGPSFETLCPDAQSRRDRMRCIFENRDALPAECLDALPHRKHGGCKHKAGGCGHGGCKHKARGCEHGAGCKHGGCEHGAGCKHGGCEHGSCEHGAGGCQHGSCEQGAGACEGEQL